VLVAPESIVVPAKRSATFRATLRLPRDAEVSGTLVKGLRLKGMSTTASSSGRPTVYDTGALLVVSTGKVTEAQIEIQDLELVRSNEVRNPSSAVLTIANRGSSPGHIKGDLVLSRSSGQVFSTMKIGERNWEPVMPGGNREFRMPLPKVDLGEFVVSAEIFLRDSGEGPQRKSVEFISIEALPEVLR